MGFKLERNVVDMMYTTGMLDANINAASSIGCSSENLGSVHEQPYKQTIISNANSAHFVTFVRVASGRGISDLERSRCLENGDEKSIRPCLTRRTMTSKRKATDIRMHPPGANINSTMGLGVSHRPLTSVGELASTRTGNSSMTCTQSNARIMRDTCPLHESGVCVE